MLNWLGEEGQSAIGICALFYIYRSAKFGVVVFKASMLNWLGGYICQVWCSSIQGIYAPSD